jgi:hypothetical protein
LFAEVLHLPVMFPAGTGKPKMLKTATALLCLCVGSTGALAFETPKYDRKIERAAIAQVGKKMGALRETVDVELPVIVTELQEAQPLDAQETAGIDPEVRGPMQGPAYKKFWFVAGVYH